MPFFNSRKNVFKREVLTVSSVAIGLTAANYDATAEHANNPGNQSGAKSRKASGAVLTIEANSIRVTKDGTTAPVAATTGTKLNSGDTYVLETYQDIVFFKAIRDGASDATVQVEYYR